MNTFVAVVGWVVAVMGFLAFRGGLKKEGIVALIVGILIANLPNLF